MPITGNHNFQLGNECVKLNVSAVQIGTTTATDRRVANHQAQDLFVPRFDIEKTVYACGCFNSSKVPTQRDAIKNGLFFVRSPYYQSDIFIEVGRHFISKQTSLSASLRVAVNKLWCKNNVTIRLALSGTVPFLSFVSRCSQNTQK